MKKNRKKYSAEFKAKIALEVLKNESTLAELASKYELHPVQLSRWKAEFVENASAVFEKKPTKDESLLEKENDQLYKKVGQLQVEVDWLKKKLNPFGLV